MKFLIASVLVIATSALIAQEVTFPFTIEGYILSKETKEPIPYANIFNISTKKGTISNNKGYFKIEVNNSSDSILITFIGNNKQQLPLDVKSKVCTIYLEESVQLLNEVSIIAPDDSYLYELLDDCANKPLKYITEAKAYYELKSIVNDQQIELVEGFYNADIRSYDLAALKLKAGRIAIKPYDNRMFLSVESSRAITMLKLFEANSNFPINPFQLSKNKMKKRFFLELEKKYQDENLDSIYVIGFRPKINSGLTFEGHIWIDFLKKHIIKITMDCRNCQNHPFLPLFKTDSIENVDITITKTFRELNENIFFNHIDFTYRIDYKGFDVKQNKYPYSISTNAVLYAYDFDTLFMLPKFQFSDENIEDYRKISAFPFNEFFWNNNNEFQLNDHQDTNDHFFKENESISNKTLFVLNPIIHGPLFEHPYVFWTNKRILFKEIVADSLKNNSNQPAFKADQYNLSVKIFMDINSFADSINVLTSTVIDPYESFYALPMDNATHCFINIYFDLFEIERRKFEKILANSEKDNATIQLEYSKLQMRLENLKQQYLKDVERGTKKEEMKKWNKYVYENLSIDNIDFFNLYKGNE